MMSEREKQILLQKVVDNTITKSERKLLELEALNDDFLFDALEGYATIGHSAGKSIKRVLNEVGTIRDANRKRRAIWIWLPIAAASIIGLVFVLNIQKNIPQKTPSIFAKNESTQSIEDSQSSPRIETKEEIILLENKEITSNGDSKSSRPKQTARRILDKKAEKEIISPINEISSQTTAVEPVVLSQAEDLYLDNEPTSTDQVSKKGNAYIPSYKPNEQSDFKDIEQDEIDKENRKVYGRVIDESGEALIGANVHYQGASNGTITDFDGRFELNFDSTATLIEIAYVGYVSELIDINYITNDADIVLKGGQLLDEVVVVNSGLKNKLKRILYGDKSIEKFDQELTDQLKKHLDKEKLNKNGTLNFQFLFTPDREVDQLKIIQSDFEITDSIILEWINKEKKHLPKEKSGRYISIKIVIL